MIEQQEQFESRKVDHLRFAMDPAVQASGSGFDQIEFVHEALPELDFADVSITSALFLESSPTPFFVSSMTAGHAGSLLLNERLAVASAAKGWPMGVGSQRRELTDRSAAIEWQHIRRRAPKAIFFGNIGLSQLIELMAQANGLGAVQNLVDSLEATAMTIHLNALQECLQPEGTPKFKGGLLAIEKLCRELSVPVMVKETGCGISQRTATQLFSAGVAVVDVAGRGGTHWGRVEGMRAEMRADGMPHNHFAAASRVFANWGLSTVQSVRECKKALNLNSSVWASGGIRSGLDAAKAIALGASRVGVAQPMLAAALLSEDAIIQEMNRFEFELKTAMFCTGTASLEKFSEVRLEDLRSSP